MEILNEEGVISLVEQKPTKTGKTYWVYTLNGKKFSSFNDLELSISDNVKMTYKINNGYNNAMGAILLGGEKPKISYEDVKEPAVSFDEKRRKEIQIGQSANLAQTHLIHATFDAEQFDMLFKQQAKRYFRLLRELNEELL